MQFVAMQAQKKAKEEDAARKQKGKDKQEAVSLLNQISVPLAKFEADLACLKSNSPVNQLHPMYNVFKNIAIQGHRFKQGAAQAMEAGKAVAFTKDDVKQWLNDCRVQGKVLTTLLKTGAS